MNNETQVYIQLMSEHAQIPTKAHPTDAGWDLYTSEEVIIPPGEIRNVPTGVKVALLAGWYGNIKTRSSTLVRHGLHVIEGIIDQGYRGELFIQVESAHIGITEVRQGTRLAQLLILPVPKVQWVLVQSLSPSPRGDTGFGQSGR